MAFGALIFAAFVVLRLLHSEIQSEFQPVYVSFKDIFNGLNGIIESERFIFPSGQAYMVAFQYLSEVFFLGFLATMFILRYVQVHRQMEANRRKEIIGMKNLSDYNPVHGAVTMTFFPINIVMLPFSAAVLYFRNARVSDFVLKLQYVLMVLIYLGVMCVLIVPLIPLLYLKIIVNATYVSFNNNREDYKN